MPDSAKTSTHPALAPSKTSMAYADLPEDMRVLISQFLEDADIEEVEPHQLVLARIPLSDFPDVPLADGDFDDRGVPYAMDMIRQKNLPPIIVEDHQWIDGRHRVWAAKQEGRKYITAIDLSAFMTFQDRPIAIIPRSDRVQSLAHARIQAATAALDFLSEAPCPPKKKAACKA